LNFEYASSELGRENNERPGHRELREPQSFAISLRKIANIRAQDESCWSTRFWFYETAFSRSDGDVFVALVKFKMRGHA